MNSPPDALSPSPSTPSSGSPSTEEAPILNITSPSSMTQLPHTLVSASPQSQAKRRLPSSASSVFAREGRENKSRRRERDTGYEGREREDRSRKGTGSWEPLHPEMVLHAHGGPSARLREELVDVHMVDFVRNTYGDPFDDTLLQERNKTT